MIQVKLFKIHEFKGSNNYRSNIQAYFFLQAAGFQVTIKCAEATCVDIATEMKNALDWNTCSISTSFEIFDPCKHVLAALFRK